MLAAQVFANAPTIEVTRVIGYTQRARRRSSDAVDQYVFDVSYPRAEIGMFSDGDLSLGRLVRLGATIDVDAKNYLKPIARPEVLEEFVPEP